jgi:NAD(P)-dependent dehydrogenase (short-subunit alcohol dehydrogenase family)
VFLELSERVAVVTGGASGIGYAISERLSQAGASVVIADKDEESAAAAAEHLGAASGEALSIRTDVTRPEDVAAMVEHTLESFGRLDILVNNAGINGRNAPLWEVTDEEWDALMAINLTSVFRSCRAVIGHMRERRSGAIVNMASIAGKEGNATAAPYSVSKAGVICLTKASSQGGGKRRHQGQRGGAGADRDAPARAAFAGGRRASDRQDPDGAHGSPGRSGSRRPFPRLRRRELRNRPVLRRERGTGHVLDTS